MNTVSVAGYNAEPIEWEIETTDRDMGIDVLLKSIDNSEIDVSEIDGLYMSHPRSWSTQHFYTAFLSQRLGLNLDRVVETKTGGTTGTNAFWNAVKDIQTGVIDVAAILAVERDSTVQTEETYRVSHYDTEFHAPLGPFTAGYYAQSMQRYMHEYDVQREHIAEISVKNRENAVNNEYALFDEPVTVEEVLESKVIANPLRLLECPARCDGAAAIILTNKNVSGGSNIIVKGMGYHSSPSQFTGVRQESIAKLHPVRPAIDKLFEQTGLDIDDIDVIEPYAPFPHTEAILSEELRLFNRGDGARAAAQGETRPDGRIPISPSGGCIGRGHPALVTPLMNYIEAIKQIQGNAANQVEDVSRVLTTSEHGHFDGFGTTLFEEAK